MLHGCKTRLARFDAPTPPATPANVVSVTLGELGEAIFVFDRATTLNFTALDSNLTVDGDGPASATQTDASTITLTFPVPLAGGEDWEISAQPAWIDTPLTIPQSGTIPASLPDPIAEYAFIGPSDFTLEPDLTGNGYDATVVDTGTGSPRVGTGGRNATYPGYLSFNRDGKLLTIHPLAAALTGAFSVSFWFRFATPQSGVSASRGEWLSMSEGPSANDVRICVQPHRSDGPPLNDPNAGGFTFSYSPDYYGDGQTNAVVPTIMPNTGPQDYSGATWHHLCGTIDAGGNSALYIDGAAVGSYAGAARPGPASTKLYIGKEEGGNHAIFGDIGAPYRFYGSALSASDVAALFAAGI